MKAEKKFLLCLTRRFLAAWLIVAGAMIEVTAQTNIESEFNALTQLIISDGNESMTEECNSLISQIKSSGKWYVSACYAPVKVRGWDENREKAKMLIERLFQLSRNLHCLGIKKTEYNKWVKKEYDEIWKDYSSNYSATTTKMQNEIRANKNWEERIWIESSWDEFIVKLVNQQRALNSKLNLPTALAEKEGCGSGEITIDIIKNPAKARLSVIEEFAYKLCKARNINPNDIEACPGWTDLMSQKESLSGAYYYRVTHPGFFTKTGRLIIDIDSNKPLNFSLIPR